MAQLAPSAGDVVMGILGLSGKKGSESWPIFRVYEAISELTPKNKALKRALFFSEKGRKKYSKQLEEILFHLGTTELIEMRNPEYNYVLVSLESKKIISKYLGEYLRESDLKKIATLSEEFRVAITKKMTKEELDACKMQHS